MRSLERRSSDRLKRAMIRGAVADNLETIHGVRPGRSQGPANRRIPWMPLTILALVALAGSFFPVSRAVESRHAGSVATGVAAASAVSMGRLSPLADVRNLDAATFRLAVRRVVLDPGHGGDDPGAVGSGLREKDLTLDIARRLRTALQAAGFEVVLTRDADEMVSLRQRAQAANAAHADLFLSIHVNSIPSPGRRGVETYVLGTTSDPHLTELSRAENAVSGYSMADLRNVLEGILRDARRDSSERFGRAVQGRMYTALRASNPALDDRGVKQAPFVVLLDTQMPAVLAEVACISSPDDVALLRDDAYKQRIADALAAGVRSGAAASEEAGPARRGPVGR
jgi:N-acetylmuramoyl-L-alanine amidase